MIYASTLREMTRWGLSKNFNAVLFRIQGFEGKVGCWFDRACVGSVLKSPLPRLVTGCRLKEIDIFQKIIV